jgi:hypothetical protein
LPNKERKMDENQEATAALDEAAAEAVEDQQVTQETEEKPEETEQVAETTEEVVEEPEGELPQDHKERSDLGRKLSAYHRRVDEIDNKFDRIMNYLESQKQEENPETELEPDEPITRAEMERMLAAREEKKRSREKSYQDNYIRTISGLGSDLSQTEYDAVLAEMKDITYDPTDRPEKDAEMNFLKAERIYLRKKMAQPPEKKNPLKGEKPKEALGVVKNNTSVKKEAKQPELDSYAQSYIESVRRRDGDEYADKLLKD